MKKLIFTLVMSGAVAAHGAITYQNYDQLTVPVNGDGDTLPVEYDGGDPGSGKFSTRIETNSADCVSGSCLEITVTQRSLYAQFNPYNYEGNNGLYDGPNGLPWRAFARDYSIDRAQWQHNKYNRFSFWIKTPNSGQPMEKGTGYANHNVGTYVKRVNNPDDQSDEAGGNHYYHNFNLPNGVESGGQWIRCIMNMHPNHERGGNGDHEWNNMPHPTGESNYNYYDAFTRFYIQQDSNSSSYPATYMIDEMEFYEETYPENDEQVYSIAGVYNPATNHLYVTWNRRKDENTVNHEVRYLIGPENQNPHVVGWNALTPAPNGNIAVPGWNGYNNVTYDTTGISALTQAAGIWIAIKPQNSNLFSTIYVRNFNVIPPPVPQDFSLSHLQYLGAFRVPDGATDANSFNYGGEDMTFNPYGPNGGTLRMTGHDHHQRAAEISIPTPVNSSNINSLPTATIFQNFSDPVDGRLSQVDPLPESNAKKIGGHLIDDFNNDGTPEALVTGYVFYDADTSATGSTFLSKTLTLSDNTDIVGPFRPQGINPGYIAGYMAKVPFSLQDELGAKYVTGQCNLSIIGRSSMGPSLFGFDPAPMLANNPNMNFSVSNLASYPHDDTPFNSQGAFNETSNMFNYMSSIDGVFFHEQTDSVIFVGDQKMGNICYKGNLPNCPDTGGWNSDGPQVGGLWIYKASELAKVRNGTLAPNEVMPSDWIQLNFPISGNQQASGVAYDPATRRLFIAQYGADRKTGFGYSPIIHVYKLSGTVVSNPPPPGGGGSGSGGDSKDQTAANHHNLLSKPGQPAVVDCPNGCDITIYNRFGEKVLKTSGSGLISISNTLPSGTYKIHIEYGEKEEMKNMVIIR